MRIPELRALEQNRTDPRNPSGRRCCSAPLKLSGPRKCETRHPEGWRVTRNSDQLPSILEDLEDVADQVRDAAEDVGEDALDVRGQVCEGTGNGHIDVPSNRGS